MVPAGLPRRLFAKPWVPYAEQPFRKARQVVNYIGRYSHSIAIGNHRIKKVEAGKDPTPQCPYPKKYPRTILPKAYSPTSKSYISPQKILPLHLNTKSATTNRATSASTLCTRGYSAELKTNVRSVLRGF